MSFIPQWNQYTAYAVGSVVQLNNILYLSLSATPPSATPPASAPLVWLPSGTPIAFAGPSGKFPCVVGSLTQVIIIPALTTNAVVNLTYIHPPAGGAAQWFRNYVPTANTLTITLGQVAAAGEFILWSVASL